MIYTHVLNRGGRRALSAGPMRLLAVYTLIRVATGGDPENGWCWQEIVSQCGTVRSITHGFRPSP